jgi:hypothetical protein
MLVNNELERIWKEAVVAGFQLVSRHYPGGKIAGRVVCYAIRVVSKESRRLILPRNYSLRKGLWPI